MDGLQQRVEQALALSQQAGPQAIRPLERSPQAIERFRRAQRRGWQGRLRPQLIQAIQSVVIGNLMGESGPGLSVLVYHQPLQPPLTVRLPAGMVVWVIRHCRACRPVWYLLHLLISTAAEWHGPFRRRGPCR
jgi:hypothetical protein